MISTASRFQPRPGLNSSRSLTGMPWLQDFVLENQLTILPVSRILIRSFRSNNSQQYNKQGPKSVMVMACKGHLNNLPDEDQTHPNQTSFTQGAVVPADSGDTLISE